MFRDQPSVSAGDDDELPSRASLHERLNDVERQLRSLLDRSPDPIVAVDLAGNICDSNAAARRAFALSDDGPDPRLDDLFDAQQHERVRRAISDARHFEMTVDLWREWLTPSGSAPGWYAVRVFPEIPPPERGIDTVYVECTNVTELVEQERQLARMALIDPLTGASNTAAAFDRLQHAFDRLGRRPRRGLALAVLDLDHFKSINDAHGYPTGDAALVAVTTELRRALRGHDTVGRIGGDEFMIVLEEVATRQEAMNLGERIQEAVANTVCDGARSSVRLSASVGVAWTTGGGTSNDLLARAQRAVNEAKRRGRSMTRMEQLSDAAEPARLDGPTMPELSVALSRDQFEVVYQPIVSAADSSAVAVEALLRWRHPEFGLLAPDRFLGWLLESGQINAVGQWVLRTAIRQLGEWVQTYESLRNVSLHINVTAGELGQRDLPQLLSSEIERAGVSPQQVCIEVTEQALSGVIVSEAAIRNVADVGVRIVLDDFGTGISSLSHLRTRPLHGIKVDRSFVHGAATDSDDRSIVEGIVQIAAGLGISTTAEGVETQEQVSWLAGLGCTYLQGYHFARPAAADEVPHLLGAAARP